MKKINIKSPTRVDLAGGTLDLWPLYNFIGGATTVNLAINIYTEVQIDEVSDLSITIHSKDLKYQKKFLSISELFSSNDSELLFYKPLLSFFNLEKGFVLTTESQSPVGGGLGGSSSLIVSCLKALYQFTDQNLPPSHELVKIAHNLEAQILTTPTGTQDYYPAYSGGLNILSYKPNGIFQKVLPIKDSPLKESFLLVYTGRSHHSGINNFEVLKSAVQKDTKILFALSKLNEVAQETATACISGHWNELPRLFNLEYEYRVQLTDSFTSPEIKTLKELSLKNGASAIKICGAGGGGCVLIWTEKKSRHSIEKECLKQGFQVLNSHPVDL